MTRKCRDMGTSYLFEMLGSVVSPQFRRQCRCTDRTVLGAPAQKGRDAIRSSLPYLDRKLAEHKIPTESLLRSPVQSKRLGRSRSECEGWRDERRGDR